MCHLLKTFRASCEARVSSNCIKFSECDVHSFSRSLPDEFKSSSAFIFFPFSIGKNCWLPEVRLDKAHERGAIVGCFYCSDTV